MEKLIKSKLIKSLKELLSASETEDKYNEKRRDMAIGSIIVLVELLKEIKE